MNDFKKIESSLAQIRYLLEDIVGLLKQKDETKSFIGDPNEIRFGKYKGIKLDEFCKNMNEEKIHYVSWARTQSKKDQTNSCLKWFVTNVDRILSGEKEPSPDLIDDKVPF